MANLATLLRAIADLEQLHSELVASLEGSGWKQPVPDKRLPEHTSSRYRMKDLIDTVTSPERAPVPRRAGAVYQRWFSGARAIIANNQHSRLKEFDALHPTVGGLFGRTYMTQSEQFSAMDVLRQQANILQAVPDHIRYAAVDLELEAYATLMDDEISAAQTLAKHGFLRPAGALAGVILERHLKNLLRKHNPPISFRPNATLSTLNDLCKDDVYDTAVWRHVQHLTDLRNLSAHDSSREPTKAEIGELITGVSGILRTHSN